MESKTIELPEQTKKPFYKKWWFWLIIATIIIFTMMKINLNQQGIDKEQISAEVTYDYMLSNEVTERVTYHRDTQEIEVSTTLGNDDDNAYDLEHYDDLVKEITDKMIRQSEIDKVNSASEIALQEAEEIAQQEAAEAQKQAEEQAVAAEAQKQAEEEAEAEENKIKPDDDGNYTLMGNEYTVGVEGDIIPGEYTFVLYDYYQQGDMTEIEELTVTGNFKVYDQNGNIIAEETLDLTADATADVTDGDQPEAVNVTLEEGYTIDLEGRFILDPTFK